MKQHRPALGEGQTIAKKIAGKASKKDGSTAKYVIVPQASSKLHLFKIAVYVYESNWDFFLHEPHDRNSSKKKAF